MASELVSTSVTTREFTLEFLEQITENFSDEYIIGHGGYGVVYKGLLENGEEIALKKLYYTPGLDDTLFRNEFNNLMRAQHPNIIRLVGYCYSIGHQRIMYKGEYIFPNVEERVLCFEYMQSGSLDKHISDESCGLNWHTRFRIIKGVCEGLNYLHNGSECPIYHLDLKPENILLDQNLIPKIGDFGLSRLFPSTQTYVTTKMIGTRGYMPPEYIDKQQITQKYDVFSLGVILVRIIAGHEGYSRYAYMSPQEFLENVHENWRKRLQEAMSPRTSEQVKTCIEIAIRCVEVDREKRPTIARIIDELEKVDTADSLPACQVVNFLSKQNENSNSDSDGASKAEERSEISSTSSGGIDLATKLLYITSLTFRVLQEITDDFSEERKIGQGAYGKVYLGKLENGEDTAVKMLYNNMPGIDDEQFQHEFENHTRLKHENIVRLVAYCYETHHQAMVYMGRTIFAERTYRALCFEYLQNGSLQNHLSDECNGLDWLTRYKIIKGTCEGLKHMHQGLQEPMYHLDLKPDNILLDKNMVPKLADFSSCKLFGDEHTMIIQDAIGTIGYLPIEYLHGNIVSNKLDIFSLGVIMIKIIGGPTGYNRSMQVHHQEFLDQVQSNWRNRLKNTCDSSRLEAYSKQVSICTQIALTCLEIDRHKRPTIADIVHQLNGTEAVIDKILSWSASSHSQMEGDLVKLRAFTGIERIRDAETRSDFPVMVHVTAPPWRQVEETSRAGVDIVVVFDLRSGVYSIRREMSIVINKFSSNDRLSFVVMEAHPRRLMELTFMTEKGQADLNMALLAGMNDDFVHLNSTSMTTGLREAAEILRGREAEESSSRVGCIVFLSAYEELTILAEEISPEFPVHTFGLSIYNHNHNPETMKYIADNTSGTYSFCRDMQDLKDALELFMTSILKVAATSIKITLRAHDGVAISSIESGSYGKKVISDKLSGEIDIHDIYAGEQKTFIVYLTVAESKKKLLTIGGSYRSLNATINQLPETDVFVLRPRLGYSPAKLAMHHDVAAELARVRLLKGLSALIEPGKRLNIMQIENLWDSVRLSKDGQGPPEETLSRLGKYVDEMRKVACLPGVNPRKVPYLMSWLSCHQWQRATTKGSYYDSGAFTLALPRDADGEDDD